jgi:hypothetical protein
MASALPPWQYPWDHEFQGFEDHGKDQITKNPRTGQFAAVLKLSGDGGLKVHGPFVSVVDARACVQNRCDCWKPRVKEDQKDARHVLCVHVNQPRKG